MRNVEAKSERNGVQKSVFTLMGERRFWSILGCTLVIAFFGATPVLGGASILLSTPNPSLNDAAGQVVNVSLVNNDAVQYSIQGATFVAKIGDGVSSGPSIQSIDLIGTGLFFAGQGQNSVAGGNDRTKAETAFSFANINLEASQTVTLAKITLDATGTFGQFDVVFGQPNILNLNPEVSGSNAPALDFQNGMITVVPEPVSVFGAAFACLAGFVWIRRKRRA